MEESNITLRQKISKIRVEVSENELDSASLNLLGLCKNIYNGQFLDEATLLQRRYNEIQKEKRNETDKNENIRIALNKLAFDILTLLNILSDEDRARKQLELLEQNRNELLDIKSILTNLNIEVGKEMINKLGECWSEIYQFEREFRKIKNEFVWHYIEQNEEKNKLNILSELELEINSMFEIPPEPVKTPEKRKKIERHRKLMKEKIKKAFSKEEHKVSSKEHEYFLLRFQKLFERFDYPDNILEKNKFWMPRELYFYAREYHNCYLRFVFFFKKEDYSGSYECLKNMDNEKGQIQEAIKNLNLGFFNIT